MINLWDTLQYRFKKFKDIRTAHALYIPQGAMLAHIGLQYVAQDYPTFAVVQKILKVALATADVVVNIVNLRPINMI